MRNNRIDESADALRAAERQLFAACGVEVRSSSLALKDPLLTVRVLEAGAVRRCC